jgi:hypothetical protein
MPPPITARVKKLRQEIAELTERNHRSLGPKYGSAVTDNERRFQRLIEIVEELKSLTDCKSRKRYSSTSSTHISDTAKHSVVS